MTNLVTAFGRDYFMSRFRGAFFRDPENAVGRVLGFVDTGNSTTVHVEYVTGKVGRLSTSQKNVPFSFFTSMKQFSTPRLGWRSASNGRFMSYYYVNSGTYSHRGVSSGNLKKVVATHTAQLANVGSISTTYYSSDQVLNKLISDPEYVDMRNGVEAMRQGTIMGFAVDHNIAVCIAGPSTASIMYKLNEVGKVNLDSGELSFVNDYIEQEVMEAA